MQGINRYIKSILLVAAMAVPTAVVIAASPQEASVQVRVFDSNHHDYHNWDDHEDRAYRQYMTEQHRSYREYNKESSRNQRNYWKWRHNHPDHD
jgi:hypothetical protein